MNFVISPEQTSQSGANPVILLPSLAGRGRRGASAVAHLPPGREPRRYRRQGQGSPGWGAGDPPPPPQKNRGGGREGGRGCFPAGRGRSGDAQVALRGISWAAGLLYYCCYYYNYCSFRCYNYYCCYYRCYYYCYHYYCYHYYCYYYSCLCICIFLHGE